MAEFNKRLIYQIIRKMSQLQSKKMHTAAPTKAAQKKKNEKKKKEPVGQPFPKQLKTCN